MIDTNVYITEEMKKEIIEKSDLNLLSIISDYIHLKKDGVNLKGDCPHCGRSEGFKYQKRKGIFKCFHCDAGGKTAVSFLMKFEGKDYRESLFILADRFSIDLSRRDENFPKKSSKKSKRLFRDVQLRESGIPVNKQKWYFRKDSNTKIEQDRYQSGTFNQYGEITPTGDDLLLHYIDIDGNPILYKNKTGKEKALVRIRYKNPEAHPGKDGKPAKYRSPAGSGSHLWIPQFVINAYKNGRQFNTLLICEGEKKADKLCVHDIAAVGIMGINNFAYGNEMPYQLELMLTKFGIQNVVFLLDTDWQDLSIRQGKPVDARPKSFFKAVKKFRDYFYSFNLQDINLKIFFGHHLSEKSKGIDDFIVTELKGEEDVLKEKFKEAIIDRSHENEFIKLYDITSESDYKLKEFWHLHSWPAFIKHHKDELVKIKEFTLGRLKRRVNEDGEIELAEKLLPHERYWLEESHGKGGEKTRVFFDYLQINYFLKNRGFGLYRLNEELYRLIQIEEKIVKEVTPHYIQHFVREFTAELDDYNKKDVLRMLLRGMSQYLGPDKLSNMYYQAPSFHLPEKNSQYLFFRDSFVKITEDDISIKPNKDLPSHIWKSKVIDFEPKLLDEDMFELVRKDEVWEFKPSESFDHSDIANFLYSTSLTYWKKLYKLVTGKDGKKKYIPRPENERDMPGSKEFEESNAHFAAKIISIGYLLHDFSDLAQRRAIIAMDMRETEVGRSQGGTGKSIFSIMFEHMVPTYVIDGKTPKMVDDQHLYDGVDERTHILVFDDCRVNFDFEFLFSQISRGLTVNPKGKTKYTITPPPKFVLNTNHTFNGFGNSFERRQYLIAFSDYFNAYRTPYDEYGRLMFQDWDFKQWNLFYNLIFKSIQTYLKYGLKYTIPTKNIEKRQLRQRIGENFLEWALIKWSNTGTWLNNEVEKRFAYDDYIRDYPMERKYVNIRRFKEKVKLFGKYASLEYNPHRNGESIKSNNNEFFCLADDQFIANEAKKISNEPNF